MHITIGKSLSLLVVAGYITVAVMARGIYGVKYCLVLLIPLALIWFPEEIGECTGYFRTGYVNVQTPGPIISFVGWLFLLLPVILFLIKRYA